MASARFGRWLAVGLLVAVAQFFAVDQLSAVDQPSAADQWDWAEGGASGEGGATREFYNAAAARRWRATSGDWRDRSGTLQGTLPYAELSLPTAKRDVPLNLDLTVLVRQWLSGGLPNRGLLLRVQSKSGAVLSFASREHSEPSLQPRLQLRFADRTLRLPASADTHLDPSTYKAKGKSGALKISVGKHHALLRFDLSAVGPGDLEQAELQLQVLERSGGSGTVQAFAVDIASSPALPPMPGLAAEFRDDREIQRHPQVLYATSFDDDDWQDAWREFRGHYQLVSRGDRFEPLRGQALRIRFQKGENYGATGSLFFKDLLGSEPEQMYVRYYMRLGDNWRPRVQGGKLPGFAGTYGKAGWGGRANDGRNGWSARGAFLLQVPDDNPLGGRTPIGSYVYEVGKSADFGAVWAWSEGEGAYLQPNRWYCIEQYLKLNTPGQDDGVLQTWLDGREVLNRRDLRLRLVPELRIEKFWLDVYHGGTATSPYQQDLYLDNLVIARSYIGPLVDGATGER